MFIVDHLPLWLKFWVCVLEHLFSWVASTLTGFLLEPAENIRVIEINFISNFTVAHFFVGCSKLRLYILSQIIWLSHSLNLLSNTKSLPATSHVLTSCFCHFSLSSSVFEAHSPSARNSRRWTLVELAIFVFDPTFTFFLFIQPLIFCFILVGTLELLIYSFCDDRTFNLHFLKLSIPLSQSRSCCIVLLLLLVSILYLGTYCFLEPLVLAVLEHFLFVVCHWLILGVVLGLDLFDKKVDKIEQVDWVPLLVSRVIRVEIYVEIRLLEYELYEHSFFFDVLIVKRLQLKLLLPLILIALGVHLIVLDLYRFNCLILLINLVRLLS